MVGHLNHDWRQDKWYSLRLGTDPMFSPVTTFLTDVSLGNRLLIILFFQLMVGAYLWLQIYWVYPDPNFFCDLFASIGASDITIDIAFSGIIVLLFIGTDFWRMGFSIYTYLLLFICSFGVAISVTFPIYFAMRISRQCKIDKENEKNNYSEMSNNINDNYNNNNNNINTATWQYFVPVVIYICLMLWWWKGSTPFGEPSLCVPPS